MGILQKESERNSWMKEKMRSNHKHDYSEYEERFARQHGKKLRKEQRDKGRKAKHFFDDDYYYEEEGEE